MLCRVVPWVWVFLAPILSGPSLLAQSPDPLDSYRALRAADSTYAAGDLAGAIPDYERVVARDTLHAHAWYRLGRGYEADERWPEAADALERAHALGFRYPWSIAERIARLRLRVGERDRALQWIETSLAERNENRPGLLEDDDFGALAGDPRFLRLTGAAPDSLDRVAGWRHDVRYLVGEARRLHAGPGRPAWSARFEALADSIYDRIPDLEDPEVILELDRLVNLLDDGHTGLYTFLPNRLHVDFPGLPVVFYRFDDGMNVVAGQGPGEALVGSRVTRIGPLDPDEALRRLGAYVKKDNAMTPLWLGVRFYLPNARYLVAVGAAETADHVMLTVESAPGEERRVTLPTGAYDLLRKLRHPSTATVPAPLWMRDVDLSYRLVPLPDIDAVYLPFNQVRDIEGGPTLAAFADSLRAELERTGATNLIVDVRHNNGGNAFLLRPLIRTLVWWERDRPDHRIWVATGRNTFSAAQIFIDEVERWTDAVFVGERSSSRPNFTGEETSVMLPWSGVRGSISSRYNQVSDPMDDRAWIDVDLPVRYTAEEYFAGRDPVLETITRAIEEGVAGGSP